MDFSVLCCSVAAGSIKPAVVGAVYVIKFVDGICGTVGAVDVEDVKVVVISRVSVIKCRRFCVYMCLIGGIWERAVKS